MKGKIINITRFCTDDGPGIRTTVFLKGCPLKCIWCHNPESQSIEDEKYVTGEVIGKNVTAEEVFKEVIRDKVFYDTSCGGLTVSGGEPLIQPKFTAEILSICKKNGIHTAIETCGFADEQALQSVMQFCDLVLFDIKETNEDNHVKYTGVSQKTIIQNLKQINEINIPFIIRLPIVPGLNDRKEHFLNVKRLVGDLKGCRGIELMPYHRLGEYKYAQLGKKYLCSNIAEPNEHQVEKWKEWLNEL